MSALTEILKVDDTNKLFLEWSKNNGIINKLWDERKQLWEITNKSLENPVFMLLSVLRP